MQFRRFLGNFAKTYLALGALSVSAFAGADYQYNNDYNNCNPCPTTCHSASCCADSCCGHPINPAPECGWAYNPPAYARCGCETNNCCNSFLDSFAFRADFLWWRACVEGIELGTEELVESFTNSVTPPRVTVYNRAHTKRPNFKYDPGFRIGLANTCACDCWDFAVNWTHFRTKAKARGATVLEDGIVFIPDWERILGATPLVSVGRYKLNLDLVDIEFGRKYFVSNCFALRPQFGLRIARIEQTYNILSSSNFEAAPDILIDYTSSSRARSDFLAVGPRVGLDLELQLCGGLSLFGQASGSVVFGKFDNHAREHFRDFTTSTALEIDEFDYEEKSSVHRCSRAITDLAFGVKWQRCLEWCNRSHPVTLAFAWEHHAFYNLNNFNFTPHGVDFVGADEVVLTGAHVQKHGDIYTQGLTVTVAFGF